jgi:SAM-dependent methyltransferase
MNKKPSFLQPEVAAAFENREVAGSYRHRPPYPSQVFALLSELIEDEPRAVLDIGCGTGLVARPLAPLVDRLDAVDPSLAMIEEGKRLPGGDNPRITWIVGRAEDAPLHPPYALATAGDSLHWMNWETVLPRLAGALSPEGHLAILGVEGYLTFQDQVLGDGVLELIRRFSTLSQYQPEFDLVDELEQRGLFRVAGRTETDVVPFRQSIDEYIESFHARASLSWDRMAPDDAAAFDSALRELLLSLAGDVVELPVRASIVWGKPLAL